MSVKSVARVAESTSTTGPGTISLAGAKTQDADNNAVYFQAFGDELSSGDVVTYYIEEGNDWEFGQGTFTAGNPDKLSRDTVHASSDSGAKINLSGTAIVSSTLSPYRANGATLKSVQVFTSSGTWNRPTGITQVIILVIGAGGGGGGVDGQGAGTGAAAGGGGGGAFHEALLDVTAISNSTVTIGAGGAGGAAGANNGSAGTASSWADGTNTVSANGGSGGRGLAGAAHGAGGVDEGGSGGNTTGTGNRYDGSPGTPGAYSGNIAFGGNGGANGFGGGSAQGNRAVNGAGAGNAGERGGGGGGASSEDVATDAAGGDGGDGYIIVWEFS